jgi:hypothetical protein
MAGRSRRISRLYERVVCLADRFGGGLVFSSEVAFGAAGEKRGRFRDFALPPELT